MRKHLGLAMAAGLALAFAAHSAVAEKLKIGFLPGVVDPFYQVMQLGVEKAAKDLGIEVVTQISADLGSRGADAAPRLNGRAGRSQLPHYGPGR